MVGTGVYSMMVAKVFNRFGPLKTAIVGTLISMVALLVTSRGTSIYFIMISYGIVFGIGSCFVFLPLYLVMPSVGARCHRAWRRLVCNEPHSAGLS